MTVSELIAHLQVIQERFGDIEVIVDTDMGPKPPDVVDVDVAWVDADGLHL